MKNNKSIKPNKGQQISGSMIARMIAEAESKEKAESFTVPIIHDVKGDKQMDELVMDETGTFEIIDMEIPKFNKEIYEILLRKLEEKANEQNQSVSG